MSSDETTRQLVRGHLAGALVALRELIDAIALARPDSQEFAALARTGRLLILVDEPGGHVRFMLSGEPGGDPVRILETVRAVPADDATFGDLYSEGTLPARRVH